MNCLSCGKPIKNKAVEGADYIRIPKGWHCIKCVRVKLTRWPEFERFERLAENGGRYREALMKTLTMMIEDNFCCGNEHQRKHCTAGTDECLRCWLLHLVGEEMEG